MADAQGELLRYFGGVKKKVQVLHWIMTGEAKVESFSKEYGIIRLKTKDGQSHKVELI